MIGEWESRPRRAVRFRFRHAEPPWSVGGLRRDASCSAGIMSSGLLKALRSDSYVELSQYRDQHFRVREAPPSSPARPFPSSQGRCSGRAGPVRELVPAGSRLQRARACLPSVHGTTPGWVRGRTGRRSGVTPGPALRNGSWLARGVEPGSAACRLSGPSHPGCILLASVPEP